MPSAPPSSLPVSEMPEAAPARSGGGRPDDQVGRGREHRRQPQGDDTGGDDQDRQVGGSTDPGQHPKTDGRQGEDGPDDIGRADPAQQLGGEVGPNDQPGGRRQRPQPRPQR